MDNIYHVKKLENIREIRVQAPGSKSITNRALLLAALSNERCRLRGVLFSDDSRAFLAGLSGGNKRRGKGSGSLGNGR